ncbi:MAG: type II secretion system protein GspG [Verrucomicrobiales bacterium]|nr:type II secretion system protein GspG [Verrucomicrobiales bacterium]
MISKLRASAARSRVKRFLVVVSPVVTLFAFFALLPDQSRSAWERYKRTHVATGDLVEWTNSLPGSLPPAQENFGATPLLARIGRKGQSDAEFDANLNATRLISQLGTATGNWLDAERIDLTVIQLHLSTNSSGKKPPTGSPAAVVLQALVSVEAELAELRAASKRPFAKLELNYPDPISADLPNFVALRELAQLLVLHASAELALTNAGVAFEDIRAIHRLADLVSEEPNLVSAMIGSTLHNLALQAFWEGWIDKRWSSEQFGQFQERLQRLDLLRTFQRSITVGERAGFNHILEHIPNDRLAAMFWTANSGTRFVDQIGLAITRFAIRLSSRSWRYKSQLLYNRLLDETFANSVNVSEQRVFPVSCDQASNILDRAFARWSPSNFLPSIFVPNSGKALKVVARHQTAVNQATLACALERYRMREGRYPSTLSALVPEFIAQLPHDLITGESLIYRVPDEDRFLLYSVGWNGTDDGGALDEAQEDWVWPSQAK